MEGREAAEQKGNEIRPGHAWGFEGVGLVQVLVYEVDIYRKFSYIYVCILEVLG